MMKFLPMLLLGLFVLIPGLRTLGIPTASGTIHTSNDREVWVNTATGVYHFPGTRWYGKTGSGQFMNEAEAQARGYRPSQNGERDVSKIKSSGNYHKPVTGGAEDASGSFGLPDEEDRSGSVRPGGTDLF
jgi:hypothetical protein